MYPSEQLPIHAGIFPHEDGPLYSPAVCILSLGSPAVMRFTPKRGLEGEHMESPEELGFVLLNT
jgi:hypothetical protein